MNKVLKVANPRAVDYDTYDSFVIIVENGTLDEIDNLISTVEHGYRPDDWDRPEDWQITYVGLTEEPVQVVLGSFNAG